MVSSEIEHKDAVEFGVSPKKLHIIPMGADIMAPPVPNGQEEDPTLKILFVGRIARVRRVELILKAVKNLSVPFRLTIVGGEEKTSSLSKTGYLQELKDLSRDLKISDHVEFVGPKPPENLPVYYQAANVFVYSSLYENFAQPLLEAASYGIPIVSTSVGIAPQIIKNEETGFLVPAEPQTMSHALEQLNDPIRRKNLGQKLKETVRNKFAWSRVMDQYIELYRAF
ncbi:MAG: hypothetical protein NPINA01_24290 [Nitrospinaceae bacterium]|nr:MAG: hypothetical protein NPINA01_24290 [Nitrospinaceae bacterium]